MEVSEGEAMMRRSGIRWLSTTTKSDRRDCHHDPAGHPAGAAELLITAMPQGDRSARLSCYGSGGPALCGNSCPPGWLRQPALASRSPLPTDPVVTPAAAWE
jgi:hypothetical protein